MTQEFSLVNTEYPLVILFPFIIRIERPYKSANKKLQTPKQETKIQVFKEADDTQWRVQLKAW